MGLYDFSKFKEYHQAYSTRKCNAYFLYLYLMTKYSLQAQL